MSKSALNIHRIGAVAALSGVPVSTLRVWETRYGAFAPQKTGGQHRLYDDQDVLRAGLLRQLTETGHAISTIAQLGAEALAALLHRQRSAQVQQAQPSQASQSLTVAVVGLPLAARLQSAGLAQALAPLLLRLGPTLAELPSVPPPGPGAGDDRPDVLLVQLNALHLSSQRAVEALARALGLERVIVLYRFAPETSVDTLKASGALVRREPLGDDELAALIRSVLPLQGPVLLPAGQLIPPRRYSEQALAMVTAMRSPMLCECPRHVAELITQLASFELYSQDCLSRSPQDAALHAYLSAVSGSARALFEQALARVAAHEGIELEPQALAPLTAPQTAPQTAAASGT